LPRRISRAIASSRTAPTLELSRVIRFDFHWTTDGWRISEANADVPGGYIEAGAFSQRMAEHFPGTSIIDSPARALAQSIARTASTLADASGTVALLAATGYMEDHQITAYLARELNDFGVPTCRAHPRQVAWRDGIAWLQTPEIRSVAMVDSCRNLHPSVDPPHRLWGAFRFLAKRPTATGMGWEKGRMTAVLNYGSPVL
jgi:hypothetical protein